MFTARFRALSRQCCALCIVPACFFACYMHCIVSAVHCTVHAAHCIASCVHALHRLCRLRADTSLIATMQTICFCNFDTGYRAPHHACCAAHGLASILPSIVVCLLCTASRACTSSACNCAARILTQSFFWLLQVRWSRVLRRAAWNVCCSPRCCRMAGPRYLRTQSVVPARFG